MHVSSETHGLDSALILFFLLLLALLVPSLVQAEIKVIAAEATYTMGDGETPTFAEAMVLQKAKQTALEQAGTYVESYTKVRNLDLTNDEIQTIAGGVVQVEVLQKKRSAVGEGFQFFVKIKATVATDKMEELAQRIKGKNVAGEYKQLQQDYARLIKELETVKQSVTKSTPGPQREAALDQIREYEKAFGSVQKNEGAFFQRLVTGEALVSAALNTKAMVDQLVRKIMEGGQVIELGEAKAHTVVGKPGQLQLTIPVTLRISETLMPAISNTTGKLNGVLRPKIRFEGDTSHTMFKMFRLGSRNSGTAIGTLVRLGNDYQTAAYFQTRIRSFALEFRFPNSTGQAAVCVERLSKHHDLEPLSYSRLFPVRKISFSDQHPSEAYVAETAHTDYARNYHRAMMKNADKNKNWNDEEDEDMNYLNLGNDPDTGFVVVLGEPALFEIQVLLPQEVVRNLTQIDARIVEAGKDAAQSKGVQANCSFAP